MMRDEEKFAKVKPTLQEKAAKKGIRRAAYLAKYNGKPPSCMEKTKACCRATIGCGASMRTASLMRAALNGNVGSVNRCVGWCVC